MSKVGDRERIFQNGFIDFFVDELKYTYIGNFEDKENTNLIEERLLSFLTIQQKYSADLATKAITDFRKATLNMSEGLYSSNKRVYALLKYGVKVYDDKGRIHTIYLIDWKNPTNNEFSIAEEVTIKAIVSDKRPDIVIYVNGIALSVVELKKSSVSVYHGVRQNLTNQKAHFIEPFFTTVQIISAANPSEGLRYGVIGTPEKYILEWGNDKIEQNPIPFENATAKTIYERNIWLQNNKDKCCWQANSIYQKDRFLDLIHNYIAYDCGVKKICRYNQYFGVLGAIIKTAKKEGGIIWHTQGSGKSLSMVWLAKWILENNPNARVLVITDREELDSQIEKVYKGVDEEIYRAKSGADLLEKLNEQEKRLLCSLVHKFGHKSKDGTTEIDYEKYIEELKKVLPRDFKAKGDIFVFVDECHRTQSGKLHQAMKNGILPDAVFIGFTGTPLLSKDKKPEAGATLHTFGGYIHTYKYDQAVKDGVVLDLRYEARDIAQNVKDKAKIDAWFENKTKDLTPRAAAKLKQQWGTMQKVYSSYDRLEEIANDIITDFDLKPRLNNGRGNAILVADSIYSACKFYEIFQQKGFKKSAIVTSFVPDRGILRTATVATDEDTEEWYKYETYNKMLNGLDVETFETEVKRKFVEEPSNMCILIVVDKLLTGFDAPPCTYLYIDKSMKDHSLFQAICRVNRLDGEDKDFGYIVDYKELFGNLTESVDSYTADNPFAEYDAEDVTGIIKKNAEESQKHFENVLDELETLCEGVKTPKQNLQYIQYFCGFSGSDTGIDETFSRVRERLYRLTGRLTRAFAEFKGKMSDVGYSAKQQSYAEERVRFYLELRETIGNASGDFIDFKRYEPGMQFLIDTYISADSSTKIGAFEELTLLNFIMLKGDDLGEQEKKDSAAEAIENNIRKKIIEKKIINPFYYEKMSDVLVKLIDERKKGTLAYKELLEKYISLAKDVTKPEEYGGYPASIKTSCAKRMFYDNFGHNEEKANNLYYAVKDNYLDGFKDNLAKRRKIINALKNLLDSEVEVQSAFDLVCEQGEGEWK